MRKSYWLYLIQRLPLEIILRQLAESLDFKSKGDLTMVEESPSP